MSQRTSSDTSSADLGRSDIVSCWAAPSPKGALAQSQAQLPAFGPNDVEIAVHVCALCHSDVHLVDGDWSSATFPLVPGHEIVGRVTRMGDAVVGLALNDRVGVGWQSGACFSCDACKRGREHQCTTSKVRTCVGRPGGLADRVRADHRFCFKIPDAMDDAEAAPLLCAGLTVFSALERHVQAGMRVGVIGFGGLGHLAVQFGRAMGADMTAFDPDETKREDARVLGAPSFVVPAEATLGLLADTYDVLLSTTHAPLAWNTWMATLRLAGTMCLVGVPPAAVSIDPDHLLDGEKSITGSIVGSCATMRRMFAFAEKHRIAPRVERLAMREANAGLARLREGRARYRVALVRDAER